MTLLPRVKLAETIGVGCYFFNFVMRHCALHVVLCRFRLLDFDAIKFYTITVKRSQGK